MQRIEEEKNVLHWKTDLFVTQFSLNVEHFNVFSPKKTFPKICLLLKNDAVPTFLIWATDLNTMFTEKHEVIEIKETDNY